MIEWFFYLSWAAWGTQAIVAWFNVANYRQWCRIQDGWWESGFEPEKQRSVALVIAIKGFDPEATPEFFDRVRRQRYPRYRILFTMESPDDPVGPWLREQLGLSDSETRWASGEREGLTEIGLVYAGRCQDRGQKVHNQIAAFAELRPDDEIIAFADADMHCEADWLEQLVAPINSGRNQLSTTYRYFVPKRSTFVNHVATAINGSVATLGGMDQWNNLWGGSMAIDRRDFDDIDVATLFAGSVNDDLRLGRTARRSGRRVAYVKRLLVPSPVDFTWGSLFEFGRRQYVQVRIFGPIFYKLSHLITWIYLVGFVTALVALIGWQSRLAAVVLGGVFILDVGRALARRRVVRDLFDAETAARIGRGLWVEMFLTPFWMAVHAALSTSALSSNRIRWAGIEYEIPGRDRTRVLDRPEPTNGDDP